MTSSETTMSSSGHDPRGNGLAWDDDRDFADADRGFVARLEPGVVRAADGRVVWDAEAYGFLDGECPPTAHPSLWRQCGLVARQGLYEVVPGIHHTTKATVLI